MKSFEEIYNDHNDFFIKAENEAKQHLKSKRITYIAIFVQFILLIIYCAIKNDIFSTLPIWHLCALLFVVVAISTLIFLSWKVSFYEKRKEYEYHFKKITMQSMISNFFGDITYYDKVGMPEETYNEANYNEPYKFYMSDDYIKAKIGRDIYINFAEVHTRKNMDNSKKFLVFHGLFAKVYLNKRIDCELRITSNNSRKNLKRYENKLNLDSSEFENNFDVFSSNNIMSMQLLTADIMELFLEFKNKTKDDFDIFIRQNNVYFRINSGTLFELNTDVSKYNVSDILKSKKFVNKSDLETYYYTLQFIYDLSHKIAKLLNEIEF